MDIEKLVEWLRTASGSPGGVKMSREAADALEKLQAELQKSEHDNVNLTGELAKVAAELEQVKRERDAAIKTIFQWTGCPECKWWDSADEWCEKHDRSADCCGECCSPEWRGPQKED